MGLQNQEEASDTDTEGVTISSRVSGTRQRSWGTEQRASWVTLRGLACTASAGGQPWRVLNLSVTQPMLFKALFDYVWIRGHKNVSVWLGGYRRHSGRQHRKETQVCFSSLEGPRTLLPGEKTGLWYLTRLRGQQA